MTTDNPSFELALFRELSDYALDGIIITDMELKIFYANRAAHTMFGYAKDEMIGQNAATMWLEEDLPTLKAAIPQIMNGGWNGEVRNKRKDGSPISVSSAAFAVGGGNDRPPTALAVIIRNITERKQAEETLRESETNLREAQQLAQIGSWRLDLVYNRLDWSEEIYRIFELDPTRFGASYEAFLNAIHPDDRDMVNRAYTESLQNRTPYQIEHRLLMPDGRIKFVQERCRTTYDGDGRALCSFGTVHDITERKEAEAEQERLQQEIIEAQRRALQELSTPIIPVMEGIIVMPLIGSIDSMRARDITRTLLAGIREHRAKVVILDITGVPLVDSGVANHLNKTIQAARLKGARTIITGISDAVAETIVDLGIDWVGIETLANLQTGLVAALGRLGIKLARA